MGHLTHTSTAHANTCIENENKLDCILEKLKKLDLLDEMVKRMDKLEKEVADIDNEVQDSKVGLNFLDETVGRKADNVCVHDLAIKVDDLSNRLRRNNLVLFHVPEGSEEEYDDCGDFVHDFVETHMGIQNAAAMEFERVHRTPIARSRYSGKGPRPIHVAFFRFGDKQTILKAAAKSLKDNPYKGANIFVSEDFTPALQKKRKILHFYKKKILAENPSKKVYIAYPAELRVKEGDSWRIFGDETSLKSLRDTFGRSPHNY